MSNLYQEAIADAKRLRQLAEDNAKNKILEEIAPRIKRLIEAELSDDINSELEDELAADSDGEEWDDESDDLPDLDDDGPSEFADDLAVPDLSDLGLPTSEDELLDDEPIEVSSGSAKTIGAGDDERVTVNITVEGERRRAARDLFENLSGPRTSYQMAQKRFLLLRSRLNETKNRKKQAKILLEMRKLQQSIIFNNNDTSSLNLAQAINKILKENKMSRRTRRSRRLNENAWWLREADDDTELADDEFGDMGDDELEGEEEDAGEEVEGEEVTISADDARDAAASFLDDLGFDAEEVLGGEPAEDDFELEDDEDLEGEEEEADVDEMLEQDEQDEEDEVVEISEAMIRRELRRLSNRRKPSRRVSENSRRRRRRRPSSRRRKMFESEAKAVADNFGGGKLDKEHFVEVDEDTLLNALAEELGSDANAPSGGSASKVADNFGGGSAKAEAIKEARRQRRRAQQAVKAARMNEAKAKKLKKELNESNLFNAKLLYVNKLMQQHDLNAKQQRAIVEAIDNAKTLREAKLLYTSLTESLRKRAANKASLNESAVRTGSASKSLRSSAPAKSGESLDRWAVLAGIRK